jgi:hypothetical protein
MSQHDLVILDCVNLAIEKKACQIINEYVAYWNNEKTIDDYSIHHLDCMYYYLLYAHKNRTLNIFDYNKSIYSILFLV